MEGHGIYVWSVYILAMLVLSGLGVTPLVRLKNQIKQLRRQREEQT